MKRLHLGSGSRIIPGYDNLDADPIPGAIKWWAPKLPYPDCSIEFIYTEHFIEHLDKATQRELFKECDRVLIRGGTMRISTPNLSTIMNDFREHKFNWKYKEVGWVPETCSDFLNEAMRSWGHQFLWEEDNLCDFLNENMPCCKASIVEYSPNKESRPDFGDCIIEVIKK